MFITSIRHGSNGVYRVWKFQHGSGQQRNLCVVSANPSDLKVLEDAIDSLVSGKKDPTLELYINFADQAGQIWTIKRISDAVTHARNGQSVTLADMKKALPYLYNSGLRSDLPIAAVPLSVESHGVKSLNATSEIKKSSHKINQMYEAARRSLDELLPGLPNEDLMKFVQLGEEACSLITSMRLLSFSAVAPKEKPRDAHRELQRASLELDILMRIHAGCARLMNSLDYVQRSQELFTSTNKHVQETISASHCSVDVLKQLRDPELRTQLLRAVFAKQAYGHMVQAVRSAMKNIDFSSPPDTNSIESQIEMASDHTQDLESCLASLILNVKKTLIGLEGIVNEVERVRHEASRRGLKFWNSATSVNFDRQLPSLSTEALAARLRELESAQTSAEFTARKLRTETCSIEDIINSRKEIAAACARTSESIEHLLAQSEIELSQFEVSSKNFDIIAMLTACAELDYLDHLSSIVDLSKAEMEESRLQLVDLLKTWHSLSQSAKASDFKNTSILIGEAKAASRHLQGRQKRISKLLEEIGRDEAVEHLAHLCSTQTAKLSLRLNEILSEMGCSATPVDHQLEAKLKKVIALCLELSTLSLLKEDSTPETFPFEIYFCKDATLEKQKRLVLEKFLVQGTHPDADSFKILCIRELDFAKKLIENGFGKGELIERELPHQPQRVLSAKADAALKVLNPKRSHMENK